MCDGGRNVSPSSNCFAAVLFLTLSCLYGASGSEATARPLDWRGKTLLSAQLTPARVGEAHAGPGNQEGPGDAGDAGSVFLLVDPNSQSLVIFAADLPAGPG